MVTDSKKNKTLKNFYNVAYKGGVANSFSNWESREADRAVIEFLNWSGLRVLDVGCGTGRLAREISAMGAASVYALDYSEEAIKVATAETTDQKIDFVCANFLEFSPCCEFDVIVTLGTLEHMDEPVEFLKHASRHLSSDGILIVTCPHFLNLRGIVWMTLATLLDVPMSLSDQHFIHPWDVEDWCDNASLKVVNLFTVDQSRGNGERLLVDFERRLPNALKDSGFSGKNVPNMLKYISKYSSYLYENKKETKFEGATAVYVMEHISKP